MGLVVQLNHSSIFCEYPISCHGAMLILHSNGIHQVAIRYCGCSKAIPQHLQLLCRGLYPASQISVKTCTSFQLLNLLHKLSLTTKSSTYNFYRVLEKLTNNTGINVPKLWYKVLFQMSIQWWHLKYWNGMAVLMIRAAPQGQNQVSWQSYAHLALILGSICLRDGRKRPLECGSLCRVVLWSLYSLM